jgi:hypoxanthine-DNA glycosylase
MLARSLFIPIILSHSAFWWIAGDCLGFRRDTGISKSSGEPYKFTSWLRHDNCDILPYEQQVETLCSEGFALWDIVQSCRRPGSLDQDISEDLPNDIHGFCQQHPSIRRIVLANGASGCGFFKKHFRSWLDTGEVVPGDHPASQKSFSKWTHNITRSLSSITVISALAVSPAAARHTYEQKRDFWDEYVYTPGLEDHKKSKGKQALWVEESD